MADASTMVELSKVSKTFRDVQAVRDASFRLQTGKFLTILGPSGCGKTTLLRMIAGFEAATSGEIYIKGEPVSSVPAHRRSIGMVFQRLALFPHMTAAENVAYPLKMRRYNAGEIPDRVQEYLRIVQLADLGGRRIKELSGGQQQRVAIARALSFGPDLLLLDEPLSALDKKLREEMQLEFRRIQQELNVTTINVTHDQREALVMSDEIIVMSDGVIQQAGDPVSLYRLPSNRFVANFVGLSSLLQGRVAGLRENEVAVEVGEGVIKGRTVEDMIESGDAVQCAIRAEQVRIRPAKGQLEVFDNRLAGVVEQQIFEGDRMVYRVRCQGLGDAIIHAFDHDPTHNQLYHVGETIALGCNARDVFVYRTSESVGNQRVVA